MTRFLLSIDNAVDTVFAALQGANRGETFIPIAAAATVENLAKALIGDRKIETKVLGIRPGEKIHEILISEEECNHVVRRGDYYSILPMLPELRPAKAEKNARDKEYSSSDDLLDLEQTRLLLQKHRLLLEQTRPTEEGELLR